MSRARLNIFLEREHERRLAELATMRGLSKSSIVAAALAAFLSPEGADRREAAIATRLDRLTRQFERLERDQQIGLETLALFVRYTLAATQPVPTEHQERRPRPGRGALCPVRRAAGPAPAAGREPGQGRARRDPAGGRGVLRDGPEPTRGRAMTGPLISSLTSAAQVLDRQSRMLRSALGPVIAGALADPDIVEILLNPDGSLWFDRLGAGRTPSGITMPAAAAERIIRLVASHVHQEVHAGAPLVSAELPETGERFEGVLPPIVRAPTFAIRKRSAGVIPLSRYVTTGVLTEAQATFLQGAVWSRANIVIAGGTSTGKTTLANALLQEVATTGDRVIVLEDTVELQCLADDHVPLRTRPGVVSMADLVRSTLTPATRSHRGGRGARR